MRKVLMGWVVLLIVTVLASGQLTNPNGIIETRKLFLFGNNNGFQSNQFGNIYNFLFQQTFTIVPRVGLAVYTMDFEYSPDFSCRITADTNQTSAAILITTVDRSQTNQIYLMYIVTDHDYLGVFMPDPIITDQLSIPSSTSTSINRIQSFRFNFKEEISANAAVKNIRLSIYLTGVSTISEMTQNGYPNNRTSFQLQAKIQSAIFYTVNVVIPNTDGYILIDKIQFTVVYFDVTQMINQRYQMDSNTATLQNYGGQIQPTTASIDLIPLANDDRFQNLQFFFGISLIDCKGGPSITLLGVQLYYTTNNTQSLGLLLQMQTWRLTYMTESTFNYIQFKSLKCNQPGSNCNESCLTSLKPHYVVSNVCNFCQYSCLTCNISLKDTVCDTCDPTRTINSTTNLCVCNPGYYENYQTYICPSCFPCATCETSGVCTTCNSSIFLTLNPVRRNCQCQPSYYPNYINVTTKTYSSDKPCLKCSENCLYCLNATNCLACSVETYLKNGKCFQICNSQQKYNTTKSQCQDYSGSSFSQEGRLGFDWTYTIKQNQIVAAITFSQTAMAYYYYQNGIGYTYQDYLTQQQQSSQGSFNGGSASSGFYFDDGINQGGYLLESADGNVGVITNGGSSSGGSSGGSGSSGVSSVDQSILNGDYYGYGQLKFFQMLYQNASIQNRDVYGLPYGKYNLSYNPAISNPNLVDALSRNLIFTISGDIIPYSLQATSNNTFILTARPTQTYLGSLATVTVVNQALVRSDYTALQTKSVSNTIDRFDYYTQQQVNSASSIRDRNRTLVDILWGICKYLLFVGLGWPLIPLMLAMQYIMSFNYIHTNLPLNLDYFLTSFRDFRNPSIFYNPLRNQIDTEWINHGDIYRNVPEFYQFDRGLDFTKNCFQFFFVPILAFALLGLLFLLNWLILNKFFRKDVGLISNYLVPRAALLAGAYTLVQALPVSFFYFAQITDTTIDHPNSPTSAYPTFNTALAYFAFFATCTIPLIILAGTYYAYNYGSRITKFSDANRFNKNFLQKIQNEPSKLNRADMDHPIWGGNTEKPASYAFGLAVFALPIIFGFFLAYFIESYPWQLTGIIFATALFLCFAAAASHFSNIIYKIYFIVFTLLMLAYLLLHAGIGSNRAIGTYDQWNTGYLGIGIIYAMLLSAIIFSAYLLYKSFKGIYDNHLKNGFWQDLDMKNDVPNQQEAKRVTQYRRDTKLKSTFLKNPTVIGNTNYLSKVGPIGSMAAIDQDNLHSQERMIIRQSKPKDQLQRLILSEQNPYKKLTIFRTEDNMIFTFPEQVGKSILLRQPLWIDSQNRIFDRDRNFIGYYSNLNKQPQPVRQKRTEQVAQQSPKRQPYQKSNFHITQSRRIVQQSPQRNVVARSTRNIITEEVYVINNEKFVKQGEDEEGNLYLRNPITNQKRTINYNKFNRASSTSLLHYNSTSNIKIQQTNYNPRVNANQINNQITRTTTSQKVMYANRNIIRNGQQYVDLGYDGRDFKLLNMRTNQIQKLNRQDYVRANQDSALKRLNINNQQYDYQGTDYNNKVYFINKKGQKITLTKAEFQKSKQQHLRKFYRDLDDQLKRNQQKKIIYYNGQPYQQLGMDLNGNHRLFNINTKNYLLLPNSQYTRLYGKAKQSEANLLLLQSAVGPTKKSQNSFREQEQMKLEQQTDKYFIFSQEKGSRIYVPKSRINLDQPIQIDEFNNFRQGGKVVLTKQQSKAIERGQIANQKRNSLRQIQMTSNRRVEPAKKQTLEKEQVEADDVINPSNYYKLLGIPSDRVNEEFEYKQKDIFLTERNIKGNDVMRRVQGIQNKYPNLSMLVKGETNENQEYWLG